MVLAVGFLSDAARDVLTIFGAVGVVLTAIGVFLTWTQMKKTVAANEAATKAALEAMGESRATYRRHVVSQMSRLLAESIVCVDTSEWRLAAARLRDLADLMTETASTDAEWKNLAVEVHSMEHTLTRIDRGEIQYKGFMRKWHKLQQALRTRISADLIPFPVPKESTNE